MCCRTTMLLSVTFRFFGNQTGSSAVRDQLMTVKQVAELLQISTDKVYAMAQSGEMPAIKIGQQWRFDHDAIAAWIKSCSIGHRIQKG